MFTKHDILIMVFCFSSMGKNRVGLRAARSVIEPGWNLFNCTLNLDYSAHASVHNYIKEKKVVNFWSSG